VSQCGFALVCVGIFFRNDDGTAQPICVVEVGPTVHRAQKTDVKVNCLNCVWEKMFSYENLRMTDEQFEHEKLAFKIYDKSHFTRNEVIGTHSPFQHFFFHSFSSSHVWPEFSAGSYEVSLNFIYRCKNREVFRTWVPLTRPDKPVKEWGYLLFSAYVIKKGDPVPTHDLDDDKAMLEDNLMAPDLQRKGYLLNSYFYRAQDLPYPEGSCNSFVNVRFNGMTAQSGISYNTKTPKYLSRIQFPFYAPLRSDPVEVQVWNHNFGRPDTFIGGTQFSASALMLRAVGPMWVNLYSTPKSTAHGVMFTNGRPTDFKEGDELMCEYVGRMLVRLVVVPTERNPQLKVSPCEPLVTEPPQSDYRLRFALYSATEVPVIGGYLQVCLRFGNKERCSPWVLGKEGKFHWMKQLRPLTCLVPDNLETMADVMLLLRHRVGSVVETIAYLRLNPKKLLLGDKGVGNTSKNYVINGDTKDIIDDYNKIKPHAPMWRPLKHADPDDDQKQLIAGFLLFSIGFGLERSEPRELARGDLDIDDDKKEMTEEEEMRLTKETKLNTYMDPPEFYNRSPCRVVVKLHQAVELPAGNESGLANPFVAVRFGGKAQVSKTVVDTTCPVWSELLVFDSSYDKERPGQLFINIYHQETFGRVFLARTELEIKDIARTEAACTPQRYSLTGGSSDKMKSKSFLLASVLMFDNTTSIPPQLELKETAVFHFNIQAIGLRQLAPAGYANVKRPSIVATCPSFNEKETIVRFEVEARDAIGTSVDYVGQNKLPPIVLPKVVLPVAYLSSFYVTLQLFDEGVFGKKCIGVAQIPVRAFVESFLEKNPKMRDSPEYAKIIAGFAASAPADDDKMKIEVLDDAEAQAQSGLTATPDQGEVTPAPAAPVTAEHVDPEDLPMFPIEVVDSTVNITIDASDTNVVPINIAAANLKKPGKIQLKAAVDASKDTKFARELEEDLKKNEYNEIKFVRGKQAGFSVLDKLLTNGGEDLTRQVEAGTLKCFINGCLEEQKKKIANTPINNIFKQQYVTRVFIYRAYNLVPLDKWLGKSLDPYLVVRNGAGEFVHKISTREDPSRDDPYNPQFFDCYELDTRLPANNELEIMMWSKSPFGDELIGETKIDLERRMLNEEWFGWNRIHNVPRELRDLHNISSNVAQVFDFF
jgi:hypothetical protein